MGKLFDKNFSTGLSIFLLVQLLYKKAVIFSLTEMFHGLLIIKELAIEPCHLMNLAADTREHCWDGYVFLK
jgi:hypothetical protein